MREIYQEHLTATPLSQENLHIILEDYETYLPSETFKQNYSTKRLPVKLFSNQEFTAINYWLNSS